MIMKTRLMKRLRSESGESIAEVLVALLIAAVALMMLAAMISSTVSIVNKSKTKMDEYYQNNAILELQTSPTATPILTIESSTVQETPQWSCMRMAPLTKKYMHIRS